MLEVSYYSRDGVEKEKVSLPDKIFGMEVKEAPIHHYVKGYLRNQRQGTVSTKQRSDIRGGGAKPWRQKGTGRARAGTNTSPIWVGGGRAFGPKPRNHYSKIPKKMKRAALISALSERASNDKIRVLDIPNFETPKTNAIYSTMKEMGLEKNKVLILLTEKNENFILSCRNIKNVICLNASQVNAYKVLWADYLVMTPDSVKTLEEVFGK
ncbi:MAG: 50S ribosomal protein L4 [candidate division Zixibacteria bacterium]|nr:50S ribosomal protein L4 [candidate division Zixibacteria bacterium]